MFTHKPLPSPKAATGQNYVSAIICLVLPCLLILPLEAQEISPYKVRALYNSLSPKSIRQHLAFYELYPHTQEGQQALALAWKLLSGGGTTPQNVALPAISSAIEGLIAIVNQQPNQTPPALNDNDISLIDKLAKNLGNRNLKGYMAQSEAEVLLLATDEIDIARAVFLSQFASESDAFSQLRSYEAALDLMALQIRAQLPTTPLPTEIIKAINHFVFFEMGFRFPPHSLYAKDIDLYTFLPSVLDSRRGVCLGVSILYLALAQRLNLPLEIITPPGHIYVRFRQGGQTINIETTARGIHLDSDDYLNIDTKKLQQRQLKEVIGLTHFNQASVFLARKDYPKALAAYEKAALYLPDDMQLKELMGYSLLLCGYCTRGYALLQMTAGHIPDEAINGDSTCSDLLAGTGDIAGLEAILMHVDEDRTSILAKQAALQQTVQRCPHFRAAHFALAICWLQLHRYGEALQAFEHYHELDPNDAKAEYYLAALFAERYNYPKAWQHLRHAEALTSARNYAPKALKELRRELSERCPEP